MSYSLSSASPELETDEPLYDDLQDEFAAAHARIRELEVLNEHTRRRIAQLEEGKLADANAARRTPHRNAVEICAWHAYNGQDPTQPTPNMAQPGDLKCGCTLQEALFEESLARYGVGSIHAEGVMMEPALRRSLLHLLQKRYHYTSGEFERGKTQKPGEKKPETPIAVGTSMDHTVPSDPGLPIATQA
ncbi:hypothetical protein FRC10_006683 [Ceratobasidium sp. 414]|nr:hypothetical protein FRC10_006683 [Ceratobasidium sp. 414]